MAAIPTHIYSTKTKKEAFQRNQYSVYDIDDLWEQADLNDMQYILTLFCSNRCF